jgi:2-polyprenyl-6-methoxyphenol hydroxylase-like FAD-dependent oxidoreductase
MNIPIIISGGGLIGNYISLRLRRSGIQSKIIERNDELYNSDSGIRTITLNPK